MTATETDGEVIASSLARPRRFEANFDRHATSVHRYLRRRVGEPLAEELTAQTFARALRARQQFDTSHASALPWLHGIAVNLIRMHLRSEQRRQRAFRLSPRTLLNQHQPPTQTRAWMPRRCDPR